MDLKAKSLLILAIFVLFIGTVSAEELNDTVAIENEDLSQSDTLEIISVDDNVENASIENNFGVVETNNLGNESNNVSSVATPAAQTFDAIQNVINSASAGDTITLSGTYTGSGTYITVNKNLNFVGVNQATLDAQTKSDIIYIYGAYTVTFNNITFKNGKKSGGGGAVSIMNSGSGYFTDCNFIGNTANDNGGAVCLSSGSGYFTGCNFIGNTAPLGGAVLIQNSGSGNFTDCNFTGNSVTGNTATNNGGAVYIYSGSGNFRNCNFNDNTVTNGYGGAVYIKDSSCVGDFRNCNFTTNTGMYGGAVLIQDSGVGDFINCNFISNTATTNGGAVLIQSRGSGNFTNCNFISNTVTNGYGGAASMGSGVGDFINCNFISNTATTNGGAVLIQGSSSGNFTNCKLADNVIDKTKSVIYISDSNAKLWLDNNSIVTNSTPIYINKGVITSSTVLVVLNNQTVKSPPNTPVTLTAVLYDDNGNIIGSNTGITLNVVGLKSGLTASFNNNNLNYSVTYTPTVGGVYPVTGTVPTTVANNVTEYKNGTLITGITTLSVDLVANNTNPTISDLIQYTITIKNNGAYKANSVTVEDILDNSKLEFVSCSPSGAYNPDTGVWLVENLDIDQESSLNINVRVKSTGEINNTVTVKSQQIIEDITKNVTIFSKKSLNITDMVIDILNNKTDNLTVKVTVPKDVTGDITININGSIQTKTIVDGVVIMEFSNINPGTYNMNVTYGGNDEYWSLTVFKEITVKKDLNPSDIQTEILNNSYGNTTVKVTVPADATGNITIQVNGENYTGKIDNGIAIVELFNLTPGKYTPNVIYTGDDNYNTISTEMDLEVVKADINSSSIKSEILNNSYGNTTVKVTVPENATGNITITVNGEDYKGIISNGSAIVKLSNVTAGNHTMTITYSGDDNYNSVSVDRDLEVVKLELDPTLMVVEIINNTYGNTFVGVSVPANVTGNITIKVNNQNYTEIIKNGIATFNLSNLTVGNYTMNVTYNGDNIYKPVYKEQDLEVVKANISNLTTIVVNNTYGNVTVQVKVPENVSGSITINVNGENHTETIANGSVTIKLPDIAVGDYKMNVTYNGNENYNPLTTQENLKVRLNLKPEQVTTDIINDTYGNVQLQVNVPYNVTGNVTIKVGNKTFNANISNGVAIVNLTGVEAGNHTLDMNVTYNGDDNYNPLTKTESLEVKKANITMNIETLNNTYGNTTIKVTLPEDATGEVLIKVGNETYKGIIANGSATVKLNNVTAGNHTMTITYPGDNNYNPYTTYKDLEVVKAEINPDDMKVEIISNITDKVEVKVTVPENATGNITIKIGNDTYIAPIENGLAIINITNITEGNYTMNVTYPGDNNFEPISKEVNLTVIPVPLIAVEMPIKAINITYGEVETIIVILPDNATGVVIFNVNGTDYAVTIEDTNLQGIALDKQIKLDLNDLAAGVYEVIATYSGDSYYASIANSTIFEVKKTELNPDDLKVDIINNTPGNVTLNITVPKNATGNITVTIGNETYNGTIENGSVIIKLPNAPIGNSTINITYGGDENYEPIAKQENITVDKYTLNPDDIKTEILNNTYGNTTVKITVPENVTGDITILVNNKTYNGTIVNGSAIISLPDVPAGNHTMTIIYSGDDNYDPIAKEEQLEIAKNILDSSDIKVEIINNTYGNTTVKIDLPEDATGDITIAIGNKTYNATIINGSAIIKLPDVPAGNHTMTITYSGDNNYNQTTIEETITIEKATINPDDIEIIVGEDPEGNTVITIIAPPSFNGNITLEIGGKNYTVEVINGTGSLTIPKLPAGKYEIIIKFDGNDNFNGFTKYLTIEIESDNTKEENNTSIANKEKLNNNTKISNSNSLENIKTANPIALLLLILLAIPLRRRKVD